MCSSQLKYFCYIFDFFTYIECVFFGGGLVSGDRNIPDNSFFHFEDLKIGVDSEGQLDFTIQLSLNVLQN